MIDFYESKDSRNRLSQFGSDYIANLAVKLQENRLENSKVEEYWQKFKSENNINSNRYEAWQYGFDADLLGELVLEGKKTATVGALKSYQFENVDIPRLGQYNIVLDSKNQLLCIIRTTKVEIIPFLEVSSEQVYKEGENDRTLESWRNGY